MRSIAPRTLFPLAAVLAALAAPPAARPADDEARPAALGAPKSFEAAVRAVEGATGAQGGKLHDLPLEEARSFPVEGSLGEWLLHVNHATFRGAGLYLFRHERSFGMAGDKDQLALLKTGDWRKVVRRVGTAGPKGQPSTEKVAAWLDALAKEEPFELLEIGSDYVAGRFERVPSDPAAVAKRCAEFAPDLVAGRASTLSLLAQEIAVNRTLYLIW